MIAKLLEHGGINGVQGICADAGPGALDGAGSQHQITVRVLGLTGEQLLYGGHQVLRFLHIVIGADPDNVDIVPVLPGGGSGDLGPRLYGNGVTGLGAGEAIGIPALVLGYQGDGPLYPIDGHGIDPHVSGGQRRNGFAALGLDGNGHRLRLGGDLKIVSHHIGADAATAQDRGAAFLAGAHIDYRDGHGILGPIQPGIILGIINGGIEFVNVAHVCIDVLLQGAGIGHIAGGTGSQTVTPADDAGKIGLNGLHIPVIGLLNGLQIFLALHAELLLLAGTLGLQQLVLGVDLLFHGKHGHYQADHHNGQQQKDNDISDECLFSFVFPHMICSPQFVVSLRQEAAFVRISRVL